jgi:Holliday junction DNA helicase RuvA
VQAVTAEDTKTLVRIPGLGLKTAQRLVLELRDKLAALSFERKVGQSQTAGRKPAEDERLSDVVEGLVSLGYNRNDARKAADRAIKSIGEAATMGELLKAALNILTGSGSRV